MLGRLARTSHPSPDAIPKNFPNHDKGQLILRRASVMVNVHASTLTSIGQAVQLSSDWIEHIPLPECLDKVLCSTWSLLSPKLVSGHSVTLAPMATIMVGTLWQEFQSFAVVNASCPDSSSWKTGLPENPRPYCMSFGVPCWPPSSARLDSE